jgi:hypothetical protein
MKKAGLLLVIIFALYSLTKNQQTIKNIVEGKKYYSSIEKNSSFKKCGNLKNLINNKKDTIGFSLACEKRNDNKDIEFYNISLMLISEKYMDFDFAIGVKNEKLITLNAFFYEENKPEILASFKEKNFPYKISSNFLYPRNLVLIDIFLKNGERIMKIKSDYDIPHSKKPKYTIKHLYISEFRGIIKIDVLDYDTGEIYSAGNE